ncbi:predicted protein, partial [Nematostella vectensis]
KEPLIVQTKSGAVEGRLEPTFHGLCTRQFRAIRYAEAPIGDLRFAKSKPVRSWNGVKDATQHGPICPQEKDEVFIRMLNIDIPEGSEDCLTLSIYTPQHTSPKLRAVMVWVHGGGFSSGSSRGFDPSVLVALHDVIVVTINYRLGVLGFFNIPDTDVKGNYGLFDQSLALQWVQQNIASFGGNPQSVTIFGESVGGMSVSAHLLSPISKGLFHRVIAQSGSASFDSFVGHEANSAGLVKVFADAIGCEFNASLVVCLRTKSVKEVFEAQRNVTAPQNSGKMLLTTPVVDGEFLTGSTKQLLREGKINKADVMLGVNANEGGFFALLFPGHLKNGLPQQQLHAAMETSLKSFTGMNTIALEAVKFEYQDNKKLNDNITNRQMLMEFGTDYMFLAPAVFEAIALANAGQAPFFYVFEHLPDFYHVGPWLSSMHGLDLLFMTGVPFSPGHNAKLLQALVGNYSAMDKGLSLYMMELWTNFAKYGDPNHTQSTPVVWPRFNATFQSHLIISLNPRVEQMPRADKMAFWNEFFP